MAENTAMRSNALPYPVYSVPWVQVVPILDADGDPVTSAADLDSEISLNGDTMADGGTEAEVGNGFYSIALTAANMTADVVAGVLKTSAAGAKTTCWALYPKKLPVLRSGTAQGGAAGYITLDASAGARDDIWNGCLVVATLDGAVEARIITDYTGSNQQAAVTPNWNTVPDADDTFVVYLPEGVQMPQADVRACGGSAVAAGAIPNVAAGASGGLPTANTNNRVLAVVQRWLTDDAAGTPDVLSSGKVAGDLKLWLAAAPTALSTNGYLQSMLLRWLTDDAAGTPSALSTNRVPADAQAVSGDSSAADNLETMLDGTGGQVLSLKQLNVVNSAGSAIVAQSMGGGGDGIQVTGHTSGHGIRSQGGSLGCGIRASAGASGGQGIAGIGSPGQPGIYGEGGTDDGPGILGQGGGGNAHGIQGAKWGSGSDIAGTLGDSRIANLDAAMSSRGTLTNQTTILNRLGVWTGSARNTILGAFQALFRSDADATVPSDVNADLGGGAGTADNANHSTQAIRNTAPLGTAMRGTDGAELTGAAAAAVAAYAPATPAQVLAQALAALDTAIGASPTADSIAERIKTLDDAYTAARAVYLDELAAANLPADVDAVKGVTAKLDGMLEVDGLVSRYTENALEQAPSASGATDWSAAEKQQIRHALGVDGTKTTSTGGVVQAIQTVFANITSMANWLRGLARNTADATALAEINSGGGTYAPATDSQEGLRDTLPAANWANSERTLTQTAAAVAAAVAGSTLTVTRYSRWSASLTGLGSLAGRTKLYFTVKLSPESDTDAEALVQIEETAGLKYVAGATPAVGVTGTLVVDDEAAGDITLTLVAGATSLLELTAAAEYDLKLLDSSGPRQVTAGTFKVAAAVARATS